MGLALAIAASLTGLILALFVSGAGSEYVLALTLLSSAAATLGFVEDWRGVGTRKRACIQILIAAGFGILVISAYGTNWIWIPVIAISVAAYINIANFMDGINGISGLHGGVAGTFYAVLGAGTDRPWMIQLGIIAAGVFVAFLPWNLSNRRVFLGDAGSYLLGAWIAGTAVLAVASGLNPVLVVGPTVIYLADTGYTLTRRIQRGERWAEAHRSHIYQQLTSEAGGHIKVALLVAALSVGTAAASLLVLLSTWIAIVGSLILMLLAVVFYLMLPNMLKRNKREMIGESA
ncbi:hypothetical protein GCM10027405_11010 [Arthrobacter alkaliphilus]